MPYPPSLEALRVRVESALRDRFDRGEGPGLLRQAMAWSLFAGGKRIRPALVVASRELFEGPGPDPWPAACALEYVHTYSLIHDDLPAMDDDDLRRGRPTCHRRFDEATAILAGDALLTEAFELLARAYAEADAGLGLKLVAELAAAAGAAGMVGGQALDMRASSAATTAGELERIHRLKTGALITAAVRCGGLLGGAGADALADLTGFGRAVGLAFQVADDVQDVVGEPAALGKTAGKDQAQGKATYPALLGLEASRSIAAGLLAEATARLERFGPRAAPLRDLAGWLARTARAA